MLQLKVIEEQPTSLSGQGSRPLLTGDKTEVELIRVHLRILWVARPRPQDPEDVP